MISDIAGIATAVGVLFAAVQLLLGRSQARTSFEDEVTAQYRNLIKPTLATALLTPLSDEQRKLVKDFYEYFDLSNEQVFLRVQGRVRRRTWIEWSKGIQGNLEREPIRSAWLIAVDRLPEFEELRLLHETEYRDPRAWNPWWRRLLRRELPVNDPRVRRRLGQPPRVVPPQSLESYPKPSARPEEVIKDRRDKKLSV